MDYRILGPLEVRDLGRVLELGGEKQRALLAILLLHRNEVVSAERLIDGLWGESRPASAGGTLHAYVSRLRKALGTNGASLVAAGDSAPARDNGVRDDGVLLTRGHGYVLRVAPGELDADRFGELIEQGRNARAAGRAEAAAGLLREALALWRGPPLGDFCYEPFAQVAIRELEEHRLEAVEDRAEVDLELGRAREVIAELRDLAARNPLRERVRAQLMLALYRCGRQAEALEVYQEFRRALSEQLGLEPGRGLQQLELAILTHDPRLDRPAGAAVDRPAARSPVRADGRARVRRRAALAVGASMLVGLAVVGTIIASSRGSVAATTVIPGDSVGVITPSRDSIRAVVPLGASPSALATGDGSVWTANYNGGTVSRIDPDTRALSETVPVGTTPAGLAIGAGAVWVTDNYGQTVSRIDPAVDRVVQTIPVGNAPTGIAVGDGSVWVVNSSDGTLTRIDAVTGAVVTTIPLGAGATEVATGAGAVWVSDEAGDRVFRIDPQTDQVSASINVGTGPTALAVAFASVWVINSLDGTVSRIDPQTNTVAATIAVGDGADAIATGGGATWVSNRYAGTVSRINSATDTVTRTIRVGNRPQGLAFAGGLVWVGTSPAATAHRGGTLTILTAVWPTTIDPVLTPVGPFIQLTYDGLTAYQRVGGSGSVQVVPDLTVSLPSPTDGGTAYTFELRRGIRFSNGEMVRPEDFRRALERDLVLGPNSDYGGPFAEVIGGAACATRPSRCDLSRGVVCDDTANTVTFHLVAPNPEFLARLTLPDAVAVPPDAPLHDIGLHALPSTGPYEVATATRPVAWLVRNPYFHEWSHAARPDGYPDRLVYRLVASRAGELAPVERGTADYALDGVPANRLGDLQTRFAGQLHVNPLPVVDALVLNTRIAPFTDVRVNRALNDAIDRGKIARLVGLGTRPTCQILPPYLPGYERYCPYTLNPQPAGIWRAPNLAKAERIIALSHTRGTPITIWNLGQYHVDYTPAVRYLVALFDRLGYPTRVKNLSTDTNAGAKFADSRARAQAAIASFGAQYLSASQLIQVSFACRSYVPDSPGNANLSEFCDPRLDSEIQSALAAEGSNSPDARTIWAQADRTVTDDAPVVPLTTESTLDFVSSRVGNYQYSFQQGVLLDQLWVH